MPPVAALSPAASKSAHAPGPWVPKETPAGPSGLGLDPEHSRVFHGGHVIGIDALYLLRDA